MRLLNLVRGNSKFCRILDDFHINAIDAELIIVEKRNSFLLDPELGEDLDFIYEVFLWHIEGEIREIVLRAQKSSEGIIDEFFNDDFPVAEVGGSFRLNDVEMVSRGTVFYDQNNDLQFSVFNEGVDKSNICIIKRYAF